MRRPSGARHLRATPFEGSSVMVGLCNPTRRSRWQKLAQLTADAGGTVAIEYGLLAALIAMAILGSLRALGISLINLPLPSLIAAFESALS
jgi:Flp pilus assembly pilin Flp